MSTKSKFAESWPQAKPTISLSYNSPSNGIEDFGTLLVSKTSPDVIFCSEAQAQASASLIRSNGQVHPEMRVEGGDMYHFNHAQKSRKTSPASPFVPWLPVDRPRPRIIPKLATLSAFRHIQFIWDRRRISDNYPLTINRLQLRPGVLEFSPGSHVQGRLVCRFRRHRLNAVCWSSPNGPPCQESATFRWSLLLKKIWHITSAVVRASSEPYLK